MTREEAIKILKELPNSILGVVLPFDTDFDYTQALDMAIKALEQQPCDDCVSRKAVLDMATTIQTDDNSGNELLEVVEVDDVKALPSVTPTHGTCKDCKYYRNNGKHSYCSKRLNVDSVTDRYREPNFYCADFEKGRQ